MSVADETPAAQPPGKRRGEIDARNWPSRSMKWVIDTIGACDSPVRARAWQVRHLLPLRSIW